MRIRIAIVDGPLAAPRSTVVASGAGALLLFEGIVREREGDGLIDALEYEVYEPMASTMLRRLAEDVIERHGLLGVAVEHSRGRVDVGGVSFRLVVESVHRKEGLLAADEFIDRLKRDVPIWKRPVWRPGEIESGGTG